MQQLLQHHKVLNDRWPTYEEFMGMMKQHNIKFTALKPWEVYGYDSETGAIVILRNNTEKKRIFKEAGLENGLDPARVSRPPLANTLSR